MNYLPMLFASVVLISSLACNDDSSVATAADTTADTAAGNDSSGRSDTGTDTSGAGGEPRADTGTLSGDVMFWSCSVRHLADLDSEAVAYMCVATTEVGPFTCDCAGEEVEGVTADGCDEALMEACDVEMVSDYCSASDVGVCVDDDEVAAGWRCDCSVSSDRPARSQDGCRSVLFASCAQACDETDRGQCAPDLATGEFDCTCDDGRSGSVGAGANCDSALSFVCANPACETSAGRCFVAPDSVSFDCACTNADTLSNVRYDDLGHDNGCQALEGLCGPEEDDSESCQAMSADGMSSGSCTGDPNVSWSCSCQTPTSTGEQVLSAEGRSCETILASYCPEAFD